MIDTLLVLNAGSSSLKFRIFRLSDLAVLATGQVSRIGDAPVLSARLGADAPQSRALASYGDHEAALSAVLDFVNLHDDGWRLVGVAHRIVHGGTGYAAPVIVTPGVLRDLETLIPLAPLHQPHNLAAVRACLRIAQDLPNIACFDTAFHAGQSDLNTAFAVSARVRGQGVRRYGFHGLSYQWIAHVLAGERPDLAAGRVVVAHLGNGASLCAMAGGASVATTMGMTALDGLPMGTRAGAIDAGAVLYMQRRMEMDIDETEAELYRNSGLLGLSGESNDVETLLASDTPDARFALDYFALKVAQYTAMMAVSLGGIDAMVFTGGIGEHAASVRDAVLGHLAPLGAFDTLVIPANEERMMAQEAQWLLRT